MKSEYLEVADRIGARLCRDALWSGGRCNWTADRLDGRAVVHASLGPHLYEGTAGIALFLRRLAEATGECIFERTAQAALRHAISTLPAGASGLYSGRLGILFAASQMGREIDEAQTLETAAPDPRRLDVMSGSAGAIVALLGIGRSQAILEDAVRHGDFLAAAADRGAEGWSWKTIPAHRNCTGLSHGAAGIGWALLELWRATGEDRFRAAGMEAFRYERSLFHSQKHAWPDFREDPPTYPAYWCHGAVGIGFTRLRAWRILNDEECLAEGRAALALASGAGLANYSLCHGATGNADFLLYAWQTLGEEGWLRSAEATAAEGIERFDRRRVPWPCGLAECNELPGLMLGLAGIGSFYLRLADPERHGSVLMPM